MIEKIKKYLLRHSEIERYNKNESGSEYFKIGSSKIQVSDHLATSLSDPTTLNIVVNGDQFVVFYGNKLINVNNYNEFKTFLKYHIQMCGCFKSSIKKATEAMKKNTLIIKEETNDTYIIIDGEKIDISDWSPKKRKGIHNMAARGSFKNKESLLKHLSKLKKD